MKSLDKVDVSSLSFTVPKSQALTALPPGVQMSWEIRDIFHHTLWNLPEFNEEKILSIRANQGVYQIKTTHYTLEFQIEELPLPQDHVGPRPFQVTLDPNSIEKSATERCGGIERSEFLSRIEAHMQQAFYTLRSPITEILSCPPEMTFKAVNGSTVSF